MTILTVGQGMQFATISSAVAASKDGDILQVQAGVYTNDFATINTNITLQGVGGMVKMVATGNIPNGKGILITRADVTIDNFEFSGAKVDDENGAGIRYEQGDLTITDSYFHDNQNGILSAPSDTGTITIRNSEFDHNGVGGDGHTHNLYVGDIAKLTVDNSLFHDAVIGHQIKSRAAENIITNNRIYDESGTSSYSIDLPNGGKATISGNVIQQGANGDNPNIIAFGEEGLSHSVNSAAISNNIVLNDMGRGTFIWDASGSPISVTGTQVWNVATMSSGSGVSFSGTTQLGSKPALDLSSPWAGSSTPPPSPPPPPPPPPPSGTAPVLAMGADVTHAEGNSGVTAFTFEAIRTGDLSGASSAKWAVELNGMTTSDLSGATSGTVNFAAGQSKATITVNVQGDTAVEGVENFIVRLSNPTGATLTTSTDAANNPAARGYVTNDDSAGSTPAGLNWTGGSGNDVKAGGAGADTLSGAAGNDSMTGSDGSDSLIGGTGADTLNGNAGADSLYGGAGVDTLYGSAGADRFIFRATSDSQNAARDTIKDFSASQGDKIDLSGIDANASVAGDQAFTLVSAYTNKPGQMQVLLEGDHYLVKADVNGDGASDFFLNVYSSTKPSGADFIF